MSANATTLEAVPRLIRVNNHLINLHLVCYAEYKEILSSPTKVIVDTHLILYLREVSKPILLTRHDAIRVWALLKDESEQISR